MWAMAVVHPAQQTLRWYDPLIWFGGSIIAALAPFVVLFANDWRVAVLGFVLSALSMIIVQRRHAVVTTYLRQLPMAGRRLCLALLTIPAVLGPIGLMVAVLLAWAWSPASAAIIAVPPLALLLHIHISAMLQQLITWVRHIFRWLVQWYLLVQLHPNRPQQYDPSCWYLGQRLQAPLARVLAPRAPPFTAS
jgi:hypothetical protein